MHKDRIFRDGTIGNKGCLQRVDEFMQKGHKTKSTNSKHEGQYHSSTQQKTCSNLYIEFLTPKMIRQKGERTKKEIREWE